MGTWFDGLAKRSARAEEPDSVGLTRRQVLARGAVVTGAAWTAPMLLAVRPAFAGASICTDAKLPDFSVCGDNTTRCCPTGEKCVLLITGGFDCSVPPGGDCNNRGNGKCNGGFSRCDQPSNTARFGVCGGPGTICSDGSNCQFNNCATDGRCGGAGATCATDAQCAPFDANDKIAFTCVGETATQTGTCAPVA